MSKKNSKNNQPSEEQKRAAQLKQMKKKQQQKQYSDPVILKDDLFRLQQSLKQIVSVRTSLQEQIHENQSIYVRQTYKIEAELKKQQEMVTELENQFNSKQKNHSRELQKLKKKQQEDQEIIEIKRRKELEDITLERDKLKGRVDYLKAFPERKKKYLQSLDQLNLRNQKMRNQQQRDIGNIRNQHQKARDRLEKDTKEQLERIKVTEVDKLEKKMTREQFIKKENEVMERQIALCEQNKKILEQQCASLIEQISRQKSNQGNSVLGAQASQTYERSLRIIKLEGKLNKMKTALNEQVSKLTKQYDDIDGVYNRQFHDIQNKISKVEGWLRMKQRDLKKVKACSQMVLNQRNNLQSYLLQVFYEHPDLNYKDERNTNRILRFLFAKINSRKPPMNYKNFINDPSRLQTLNQSSIIL